MKQFILDIFNSSSHNSSKRFFGGIGWICSITFIAIWQRDLIEALMWCSAGLIGLDTLKSGIVGLIKPKNGNNSEK